MKILFPFSILVVFILNSCNSNQDKFHTINNCQYLLKTATTLKEYNDDKMNLLQMELVNNRSHLKPLYSFLEKSESILLNLERNRNNLQEAFLIVPPQEGKTNINITPISYSKKEAFCKKLLKTSLQIDSLIDSLFSIKLKTIFFSDKESIKLKERLPLILQSQWLKNINQALETVLFDSKSNENNMLSLYSMRVQIQQAQFSLLAFIDKKAGSLHRYSWKDELRTFVFPDKNPIYENEEFIAKIGIVKQFINEVKFKVEINGKKIPIEKGTAIFKTKNYKLGRNKIEGTVIYWNPITQQEKRKNISTYFEVIKQ